MTRLLTAAVLAPLLWVVIKLAAPWIFVAIAVVLILAACLECYRMLRGAGAEPIVGLGLALTAALLVSFALADPRLPPVSVLTLAVLATVATAMACRATPRSMLDAVGATLFPVLLLGATLGHLLALRRRPEPDGTDVVLLLFLCVILGDTAAYYVGSAIGRHRMAPTISPGKSWEGFAGAIVGSVLAALVAHLWFYQRLPLGHAIALGVILGLAGVTGDLAESMVKRACGVKDSSGALPGHGGWLDRTDSLLFAAPILYHYHMAFLRGLS
jgi:phosphatidate cytidylyltransferase